MRWTHVDLMFGAGVDPTAGDAAASECESVSAVSFENGQFKLAIKRCGGNWRPFHRRILNNGRIHAALFHAALRLSFI